MHSNHIGVHRFPISRFRRNPASMTDSVDCLISLPGEDRPTTTISVSMNTGKGGIMDK
jgi:hypothetical protein